MKKYLIHFIPAAIIIFATSCNGYYRFVISPRPMPPGVAFPISPGGTHVWVDGEWFWNGRTYTWRDGYWANPLDGQIWIQGSWKKRRSGWYWHQGHWKK